MHDYAKKGLIKGSQQNKESVQPEMTNGIPNSALQDVMAGKKHATSEMMGHSQNLAPSIAAKMSRAFGMDLTGMQVYQSDAMKGTGMQGMAQGNKVVLSSDVNLNTTAGQAVLGHEISHIHAQSQGIGMGNSGLYENAALEHQADTEGMLAAQGRSIYQGGMDTGIGMSYGLGMQGVEGLTAIGSGMSAAAGAPLQASKNSISKEDESLYTKYDDYLKADFEKKDEHFESLKNDYLEKAGPKEDFDDWIEKRYLEIKKKKNEYTEKDEKNAKEKEFFGGGASGRLTRERYQAGVSDKLNRSDYMSETMTEKIQKGTDTDDYEDQNDKEALLREHQSNINWDMSNKQNIEFFKTLSDEERMTLFEYTTHGYRSFNRLKRKEASEKDIDMENETAKAEVKKLTKQNASTHDIKKAAGKVGVSNVQEKSETLDKALEKYEAPYNFTVWRAIQMPFLAQLVNGGKKLDKKLKKSEAMRTLTGENLKGKILKDPGYMSSTTNKDVAASWGKDMAILEIEIQKGSHVGAPIGDLSVHDDESEFLLSANTELEIVGSGEEIPELKPMADQYGEIKKKPTGRKIRCIKCRVVDNASGGKKRKEEE